MLTRPLRPSASAYSICASGVEHPPFVVDREAEFAGDAVAFGIGGPLPFLPPHGLACACDAALEFRVEPDAPDGGSVRFELFPLLPAGAVDGGVVRGFRGADAGDPDLLPGIHPVLGGELPDLSHALPGEGEDLERVASGSRRAGLGDDPVPYPGVDGPPGRVGVAAEACVGEVAVGDGAVDTDVGEGSGTSFEEGDGPGVPARGVFSAVAVPHAVAVAAGWRGGTRVLFDATVEHLLASHCSAARPEAAFGDRELRYGHDDFLGSGRTDCRRGHGFAHGLALTVPNEHEVGDLLRVGGGAPDLPGVFFERGDPALDVGGSPARVVADADAFAGHHGADDTNEIISHVITICYMMSGRVYPHILSLFLNGNALRV